MKIAIDVSQIVYQGTGVANYTKDLVTNLLKIDQQNQYLLVGYSLRRKKILDEFFASLSYRLPKIKFFSLPLPQKAANYLWNRLHFISLEKIIGQVDVYHSSDWIQIPVKAKKITTVHDLVVYKYPQTSTPEIINTQKRRLELVKKECDLILTDSQNTKNDLIDILDIAPDKIVVVYPGVSEIFQPQNASLIKKTLGKYHIRHPFVLSVGTNDPRKNINMVIAAFKKFNHHSLIADKANRVQLVIVGSKGWGQEFIQEDNIVLLRDVARVDLPCLYSGAQFLVYPSLYEGFGLPPVEAMKCGCPVITSIAGSLGEIVANSAIIVDPESVSDIAVKMVKLFMDKNQQKQLVEKGFRNSRRFSWDNCAQQVLTVYQKLC